MVIIGAGPNLSTIFSTVPKISAQTVHVLHLVPYPNDSVTNGNRPQKIVPRLVPDQAIWL